MECLEGRKLKFQGSWDIQKTYYGSWRMFKTSACKPAALKIANGLDGPYSTLVLMSLSDGKAYSMLKETGLTLCPAVQYSKHDLYELIGKQNKVKIDLYEALLNYWLWFDQEFQSKILQRLEWNDQRRYAADPWPACQVTQEADRLLEKGCCLELREACIVRDQERAWQVQYKARVQGSRATRAQERCSESERLGLKASQSPGSTVLRVWSPTHSLQDSLKLLKVSGESLRSEALEVDGIKVAVEELS
ncbi:hypothetical protein EDD16DRAFT_1517225 [Pisolithus croceorrhizus]|nr:hypothetical protein EV401DRAFT_1887481 [Pisolithus croceorrhizus]KAI6125443.1 hypothetical protein EDD16DRAFT_1517225 [Pisolithus croceorrhizus]KAI6144525.1 hypothetical protein EDD17DRAFT_1515343 [Pisolithus thermaeus]